jgi:hypothetical protein
MSIGLPASDIMRALCDVLAVLRAVVSGRDPRSELLERYQERSL